MSHLTGRCLIRTASLASPACTKLLPRCLRHAQLAYECFNIPPKTTYDGCHITHSQCRSRVEARKQQDRMRCEADGYLKAHNQQVSGLHFRL
jgi:hypothetical protein